MLRIPTMWWIIASGALVNFNLYALANFFPSFLTRYHGLSIAQAGLWAGVGYGAAGLAGGLIAPPPNVRVWLACGHTDMRRGFDGLSTQVQQQLGQDPFSGQLFVFRGRRGDLIKVLSWDGQGLCLFAKRLEKGKRPVNHACRSGVARGYDPAQAASR